MSYNYNSFADSNVILERTSSYSISASWAPGSNGGTTLFTASIYEITASWAGSASFASKSLFTTSSSFASSSLTSSYLTNGRYTVSDLTASTITASDYIISLRITSSLKGDVTGSVFGTSSWTNNSISSSYSSYSLSSSYAFSSTNTDGKTSTVSPEGIDPPLTITNDSGLTSNFSGGESPSYIVYSFINIGNTKVFSVSSVQDAGDVDQANYSLIIDWSVDNTADGYRVFRDRNNTSIFTEYHDLIGRNSNQLVDRDNFVDTSGFVWTSGTLAQNTSPDTFDLTDRLNYTDQTITYGYYTNGSIFTGENLYISRSIGIRTGPSASLINPLEVVGNISCSVVTASIFTGTSSFAQFALTTVSASWSSASLTTISSSWASSSFSATSSSFASRSFSSNSSSWTSESFWATSASMASSSISASWSAQSLSSSWSPNQGATTLSTASTYEITSSWSNKSGAAVSSSWSSASISSSYSTSGSFSNFSLFNNSSSFASNSLTSSILIGNLTGSLPAYNPGIMFYDPTSSTFSYYNDNSQMTVNLGQESIVKVYNSGSTLSNYISNSSVVYLSGSTNGYPNAWLAIADGTGTKFNIAGVATTTIPTQSYGYVTRIGRVNGVDTSAYPQGSDLWLSTINSGSYQSNIPSGLNEKVYVGSCLVSNTTGGIILVNINPNSHNSQTSSFIYSKQVDSISSFSYYWDFISYSTASGLVEGWWYNTGSCTSSLAEFNHPGVVTKTTSNVVNQVNYFVPILAAGAPTTSVVLGNVTSSTFIIQLITGSYSQSFRMGLFSDITSETIVNGIYFEKSGSSATGRNVWNCVCISASVATSSLTTISSTASAVWRKFSTLYHFPTTSFYIDDVLVGRITSSITTSSMGMVFGIQHVPKITGAGVGNYGCKIDYIDIKGTCTR